MSNGGVVLMFRLVEFGTGRVLQKCEGDYKEFLDKKWGGMYPYRDPDTNCLRFMRGEILADMNANACWEKA